MNLSRDFLRNGLQLTVDYAARISPAELLAREDSLAVLGFGADAPSGDSVADARYLRVPLQPFGETPMFEVWHGAGKVVSACDDGIRHADDGELQFGSLEIREGAGGILEASAQAYARLADFWRDGGFPHVLRIWNYLDAITAGDGDEERYRQFCVGRVRGLGGVDTDALPAATAIGSRDGKRILQVYWLAARQPGMPLENPRQLSAYRYPREHGPQAPSFARAMLPPAHAQMPLFLSGTASIVGHASRHIESLASQLDETLANLDSLIATARLRRPSLPAHFDHGTRLKVYVRDAEDAALVAQLLDARLPTHVPRLLLHADICRRELEVEIEGMHGVIVG
ncbi:MAG TPA: pteridine-dependent deoxygenase [Pseudoxanthomonas sp.]